MLDLGFGFVVEVWDEVESLDLGLRLGLCCG